MSFVTWLSMYLGKWGFIDIKQSKKRSSVSRSECPLKRGSNSTGVQANLFRWAPNGSAFSLGYKESLEDNWCILWGLCSCFETPTSHGTVSVGKVKPLSHKSALQRTLSYKLSRRHTVNVLQVRWQSYSMYTKSSIVERGVSQKKVL